MSRLTLEQEAYLAIRMAYLEYIRWQPDGDWDTFLSYVDGERGPVRSELADEYERRNWPEGLPKLKVLTCCEITEDDRTCGLPATKYNADSRVLFCEEHGGKNPRLPYKTYCGPKPGEEERMAVVDRFSGLVRGKVESLVCHLHAYGTVDLTSEEWECLRVFAGFLFQEVEEATVSVIPRSGA
jgi:hypothetical protein